MIERVRGCIVFICDDCGDTFDTETEEFSSALSIMKENDWVSIKDGDEWKHLCEDCQ